MTSWRTTDPSQEPRDGKPGSTAAGECLAYDAGYPNRPRTSCRLTCLSSKSTANLPDRGSKAATTRCNPLLIQVHYTPNGRHLLQDERHEPHHRAQMLARFRTVIGLFPSEKWGILACTTTEHAAAGMKKKKNVSRLERFVSASSKAKTKSPGTVIEIFVSRRPKALATSDHACLDPSSTTGTHVAAARLLRCGAGRKLRCGHLSPIRQHPRGRRGRRKWRARRVGQQKVGV